MRQPPKHRSAFGLQSIIGNRASCVESDRCQPFRFTTRKSANGLRAAGRFNAQLMDFIRPHVVAGITTNEIDRLVHEYTLDHGHIPACLGYQGLSQKRLHEHQRGRLPRHPR